MFVCFLSLRLLSRHKIFKLTFFVNFSSNVLFNEIIETVFVIREFITSKHQYVENLSKACKAIINSIIVINFRSTKRHSQQITKVFIVEPFDYFNNWAIIKKNFRKTTKNFFKKTKNYRTTQTYQNFLSVINNPNSNNNFETSKPLTFKNVRFR